MLRGINLLFNRVFVAIDSENYLNSKCFIFNFVLLFVVIEDGVKFHDWVFTKTVDFLWLSKF